MKNLLTRYQLVPFAVVLALGFGLMLTGEVLGGHGGVHRWIAGTKTFKAAVTSPLAVVRNDQLWAAVPSATVTVPLLPGRSHLINAAFAAESQCTGTAGTWCSLRILVGTTIAEPNQVDGSDFSFNAAATDNWESHAMIRHLCVRNARTTVVSIPVIVQWRSVGNATHRLDDYSVDVQRADNCSPVDITIQ
jgi:hypothetical protein